jgi:hypothetical protein
VVDPAFHKQKVLGRACKHAVLGRALRQEVSESAYDAYAYIS